MRKLRRSRNKRVRKSALRGGHLRAQGSVLGVLGSPTTPGVPSTADLIDYVESIANASSTDVR